MGIFSKKKAAEAKGKTADAGKPSTERKIYYPRYAERDGMIGRPTGYKAEEQEAFKRAYQARMSREMSESSWSLPNTHTNPKMSPRMSRNSSSMSLDWGMQAGPSSPSSSSRQGNPFATPLSTRPSSFQSLPHVLAEHNNPPVPAVPHQYASQVPTPLAHSRNSSFAGQPPSTGGPQYNQQYNQQYNRPRMNQRNSFAPAASPLGRTPEASHAETSPVDSPLASANHSSAASTASSASGEVIEIPTKADSPAQYRLDNNDREYPNDPRHYDTAAQTPRSYFAHSTKPEVPAAPKQAPAPVKKSRFSIMKRSQAVAAH